MCGIVFLPVITPQALPDHTPSSLPKPHTTRLSDTLLAMPGHLHPTESPWMHSLCLHKFLPHMHMLVCAFLSVTIKHHIDCPVQTHARFEDCDMHVEQHANHFQPCTAQLANAGRVVKQKQNARRQQSILLKMKPAAYTVGHGVEQHHQKHRHTPSESRATKGSQHPTDFLLKSQEKEMLKDHKPA